MERVEAELTALAASGATSLVGLMVSDAWGQVRGRLAAFFARGGDGGTVGGQLDSSRAELVAAQQAGDADTAADVADEWRARLRRVLRADPAAAAELRALLDEFGSPTGSGSISVVHNTFSGTAYNSPVIQARDVNNLSIGGAWPTPPAHPTPPATPSE